MNSSKQQIKPGIAINSDLNLLLTCLPLFTRGKVGAIEWSFDAPSKKQNFPAWFPELLSAFSAKQRLIGHGIFFSLFSGKWHKEQQEWLDHLKKISNQYQFDHITEHYGFMTGADFHQGAPLAIPMNTTTLQLGIDRLKRIQDACLCPVGIENLAFSYSIEETKRQGSFLEELITPVNGFIILDLHNLYCQLHNFEVTFEDIIKSYPLDRVREIHISGGSWEQSVADPTKKVRRDTHDEAVPDEVFELLDKTIGLCPNLQYVILEQLGSALETEAQRRLFQKDFYKIEKLIQQKRGLNTQAKKDFMPDLPLVLEALPLENLLLYKQQMQLSDILETAVDNQQAKKLLEASSLINSGWNIERWDPAMVETAMAIAQKWKNGFNTKLSP